MRLAAEQEAAKKAEEQMGGIAMGGIPSGKASSKNDDKFSFMKELAAVTSGKAGKHIDYDDEEAAMNAELDGLLEDYSKTYAPKRGGGTPSKISRNTIRCTSINRGRKLTYREGPA